MTTADNPHPLPGSSPSILREDTQDTLIDTPPCRPPPTSSRRPWETAAPNDTRSIPDPYDARHQSQLVTQHSPFAPRLPNWKFSSPRRLNRRTARYAKRHPFVLFLVLSGILMVLAMTAYSSYNWAYGRMFGDVSTFIPPEASGIVLLASVSSIDLDKLEASITWLPYGCGEEYATPLSSESWSHFPLRDPGKGCGRLNRSVQFIVNDAEPFLYQPLTSPDYKYTGTSHSHGAPDQPNQRTWIPAFDAFNTTEQIVAQFALSSSWNAQAYYPFDAYTILMRVWAREIPANFSADPLPDRRAGDNANGTSLPIVKVFSVDSPTGFPLITGSWDVFGQRPAGDGEQATEAIFQIKRHTVVKAFALIVFFVNWALMLVMVWILVLVYTDRSMAIPREILLLPITAILTIPQLRATMPGVPNSFGILIDIPGYFFTMTIVVICAMLIVLRMMYQAAHPRSRRRDTGKPRSSDQEKGSRPENEDASDSECDQDKRSS